MALGSSIRLGFVTAAAVAYLGAYRAAKLMRGPSRSTALRMLRSWSALTCRVLGLEVRMRGGLPSGRCVYIANHRSYLDIPVLAALLPGATFLSNDDVATWPVVGAAAAEVGVVFVDRAEMQGRIRALRQIARCVRERSIVVFPEGTTGGERLPREFHGGLLRLLQRLDVSAVPVTLRYSSRRAYWIEDIGVGEHLRQQVLGEAGLTVEVHIGRPLIASRETEREVFAAAVYAAVCTPIEEYGELASSPPPFLPAGV